MAFLLLPGFLSWTLCKYFSSKVYRTPLQKMKLQDHLVFWGSKVLYVLFYIVLPIMLVGAQAWVVGFITMHLVMGFTLAIVFQLAHVVEETSFEVVGEDDKLIENEWAIHQIKTTANFSPNDKVVSWFVGGLNYQVEHHLFPASATCITPPSARSWKRNARSLDCSTTACRP